jgi:DNA recombination protein RmuC
MPIAPSKAALAAGRSPRYRCRCAPPKEEYFECRSFHESANRFRQRSEELGELVEQRVVLRPTGVGERDGYANEASRLEGRLESERAMAEDRFRSLSADALKQNNEQFLTLAKQTLGTYQSEARGELEKREKAVQQLVAPISEQLKLVDTRLERLDRDRVQSSSVLQQQLRTMVESQDRLRGETGALVAALRKPQARGRWGEMQLRNVVEMAGMVGYCDFAEQVTVRDDDRTLRPDLVVNMPGGKKVVVDAKAPLQAFLDAYDSTEDGDRDRHLAEHARLLRDHVQAVGRNYWSQFSEAGLRDPVPARRAILQRSARGRSHADPAGRRAEGADRHADHPDRAAARRALRLAAGEDGRERARDQRTGPRAALAPRHRRRARERARQAAGWCGRRLQLGGRIAGDTGAGQRRRFTEQSVVGEDKQIQVLEPVDRVPRSPQAPELTAVNDDEVVEAPRTLGAA